MCVCVCVCVCVFNFYSCFFSYIYICQVYGKYGTVGDRMIVVQNIGKSSGKPTMTISRSRVGQQLSEYDRSGNKIIYMD